MSSAYAHFIHASQDLRRKVSSFFPCHSFPLHSISPFYLSIHTYNQELTHPIHRSRGDGRAGRRSRFRDDDDKDEEEEGEGADHWRREEEEKWEKEDEVWE